jgi:hypothetical protein
MQQVGCTLLRPIHHGLAAVSNASCTKRDDTESSTMAVHQQHMQEHRAATRSSADALQSNHVRSNNPVLTISKWQYAVGHIRGVDDQQAITSRSRRRQQHSDSANSCGLANNKLSNPSFEVVAGRAGSLASSVIKVLRAVMQRQDEALQASVKRGQREGMQPFLSTVPAVCSTQHNSTMMCINNSTSRSIASRQLRQMGSTLSSMITPVTLAVPISSPPLSCRHDRSQLVKITVRLNTTNLTSQENFLSRVS